jgi:hypothetical protein
MTNDILGLLTQPIATARQEEGFRHYQMHERILWNCAASFILKAGKRPSQEHVLPMRPVCRAVHRWIFSSYGRIPRPAVVVLPLPEEYTMWVAGVAAASLTLFEKDLIFLSVRDFVTEVKASWDKVGQAPHASHAVLHSFPDSGTVQAADLVALKSAPSSRLVVVKSDPTRWHVNATKKGSTETDFYQELFVLGAPRTTPRTAVAAFGKNPPRKIE